ncbi:hypothetical protein INR49_006095 [Caranx melampygus]|nr:hypothetical protein INR49_006095 [Caranx melampygus]
MDVTEGNRSSGRERKRGWRGPQHSLRRVVSHHARLITDAVSLLAAWQALPSASVLHASDNFISPIRPSKPLKLFRSPMIRRDYGGSDYVSSRDNRFHCRLNSGTGHAGLSNTMVKGSKPSSNKEICILTTSNKAVCSRSPLQPIERDQPVDFKEVATRSPQDTAVS